MGPAVAVYYRVVSVVSHAASAQQVCGSLSRPGFATTRGLEDASHLRLCMLDQVPVVVVKSEPDVSNGKGVRILFIGIECYRVRFLSQYLADYSEPRPVVVIQHRSPQRLSPHSASRCHP